MKYIFLILTMMTFSCKESQKGGNNNINIESVKKTDTDIIKELNFSSSDKISFIKSFYSDYIKEIDKMSLKTDKLDLLLSKYCSLQLLKRLNSDDYRDYDPFFNGQDYPPNFLNALIIRIINDKENQFSIMTSYEDTEFELLRIELIEKGEELKINDLIYKDHSL